jgi:hypothetical protein
MEGQQIFYVKMKEQIVLYTGSYTFYRLYNHPNDVLYSICAG